MTSIVKPLILAPVGDWASLNAALDAGCDEVYFGLQGFNMRANACNFGLADVAKVVRQCHQRRVKSYVAINTIVYESELSSIEDAVRQLVDVGADAVIAWDMAVIGICDRLGMEVHLSTQASVSNSAAVEFYRGSIKTLKRIILARECSLADIETIIRRHPDIEVETFVHGAMCVSVSGRCFLSQEVFGRSANRGDCLQPCRREYLIKDTDEGHEFVLGSGYILSARDMCALPFIEKLIDAGIRSLKIEGRSRSAEYVSTVVGVYRRVVDYYFEHRDQIQSDKQAHRAFTELKQQLMGKLKSVYNRNFSDGFFFGKPIGQWSDSYGSQATTRKIYVGKVLNSYKKISVAEVKIEAEQLILDEDIMFHGPTTGVFWQKVEQMQINGVDVMQAEKGAVVGIKTERLVRRNDKLYKIVAVNDINAE